MKRILFLTLLAMGVAVVPPANAGWGQKARSFFRATPSASKTIAQRQAALPEHPFASEDSAPEWYRRARSGRPGSSTFSGDHVVKGRLSATRERALADARNQLDSATAAWLSPEVPRQWKLPRDLTSSLVRASHVEPVARDLGVGGLKDVKVVYEAGSLVDLSSSRREQIINVYHRELVAKRLNLLGGGLGLALIGLAGLAAFIRADEATKGYYTIPLRLIAVAGVGAGCVALYRWVF